MVFKFFLYKVMAFRMPQIEAKKALYLSTIRGNRRFYVDVSNIIARVADIVREENLPMKVDEEKIMLAAGMALYHHGKSKRKSGEPYFVHPLGLAKILARRMKCPDDTMYAAAFLHDLKEDTAVTLDEIEQLFGREVAYLVDGLTKLEKAAEERNVEKFVHYLKEDIRILLLKATDRGHNLLTSRYLTEESRIRNAQEALDLYVPLCSLAGFMKAARQLANVAFRVLEPEEYARMAELIEKVREEDKSLIGNLQSAVQGLFEERERVKRAVRKNLSKKRMPKETQDLLKPKSIRFFARPRTPYELAQKFAERGLDAFRFSDAIMMHVIVDDEEDCFFVYRVVHSLGTTALAGRRIRPLDRYHRDYVYDPKLNLYQSLHTAIEFEGTIVRFLIRTPAMQEVAERGVISQSYRGGKFENPKLPWLDSAYLEEFMNPDRSLVEKKKVLKALSTSRYATVRLSHAAHCSRTEIPLPMGVSPLEVAFTVDPSQAMRLQMAEINGIPQDVSRVYPNRISLMDLYFGDDVTYADYLEILKDVVARKRLIEYLKSLSAAEKKKYAEGALSSLLGRFYLTLSDIKDFNLHLRHYGFRGLKQALREIGNGSISALEIFKEIAIASAKSSKARRTAKIEFYLKNWQEENYMSLTGPLRVICGDIDRIAMHRSKDGAWTWISISVPVRTKLAFRQVENFVRSVKERYADNLENVIIKRKRQVGAPFFGFEVLDAKNPYHDFIKAEVIRHTAAGEESFYVLNLTGEDTEAYIKGKEKAWAQSLEDIKEAKIIFLRIPRRYVLGVYRTFKDRLRQSETNVVYIYSDGRYGDIRKTNEFILQLLGERNLVYLNVSREMLGQIFT